MVLKNVIKHPAQNTNVKVSHIRKSTHLWFVCQGKAVSVLNFGDWS